MKVYNLESHRSGRPVPNQFVIVEKGEGWNGNFGKKEVFQSYDSVIVRRTWWDNGDIKTELDEQYWDYSKTTSKYRSQFLGETTKETQEKIDNGTYTLTNLN